MEQNMRFVIWLGDSRKQVKCFPAEVRKNIGSALYDAQRGEKAPKAKPFKSVGSGIFEIALRFNTSAYRTVYAVQIGKYIYVLHAFQKKSKAGIATPKPDVDLIKQRYKQAIEMEKGL